MSFVTGLISAYGRRAIGLGVAAVLALLFGMAAGPALPIPVPVHVAIFAAGGIAYSAFALAVGPARRPQPAAVPGRGGARLRGLSSPQKRSSTIPRRARGWRCRR